MTNRHTIAGLFLLVLIALAFRAPQLDVRPMHNDEGVNAIKLRDLLQHGKYRYDPSEYHGPTLIYSTRVWLGLIGTNTFAAVDEKKLRWLTVLFGVGLIALLASVSDALGKRATLVGGLFIAISPAMVFYSRYYIHEMLLVFFTCLMIVAAWRYYCSRKPLWIVLAGVALGLMQATKETFVLNLVAMGGAIFCQRFLLPLNTASHPHLKLSWQHGLMATAAWFAVSLILFTSFFTNGAGWVDSFRTYLPWAHRVQGASPHIHSWSFYLERLVWFREGKGAIWSEGLILLLALPAIYAGLVGGKIREGNIAFVRFLALYTLLLTVIYSAISYKTPWCLLGFWHGFILLAGVGTVLLLDSIASRFMKLAFCGFLAMGVVRLTSEAMVGSTILSADPGNPYMYAQTSPDILKLVARVDALAKLHPAGTNLLIQVVAPQSEYWPLPWYLRNYAKVGWFDALPPEQHAPIMIVSTAIKTNLEVDGTRVALPISELRPKVFFELYVEKSLYEEYLRTGAAKTIQE